MRTYGKGQQFDKLWTTFNSLNDLMILGFNKTTELEALKNKVLEKQPKSNYEIHDKANLLDQITNTIVFYRQNYKED